MSRNQQIAIARPTTLTLRNPGLAELTDKDIRKFAPAVFTDHPRSDMSGNYTFVPTFEIMDELRKMGWGPTEVQTYYRKRADRVPYAMHLLRFSERAGRGMMKQVGDSQSQIVFRNSHDGSSQFETFIGRMRLACLNGLIVSDQSLVEPIRVRHVANPVLAALTGIFDPTDGLITRSKQAEEYINEMRGTKLDENQRTKFAVDAMALLAGRAGVIEPRKLLQTRRNEDSGHDLWTVYNVVQENIVRGGLEGLTADGRATKTRGTSKLGRQLDVNAALWSQAMAVIGKAAAQARATTRAAEEVIELAAA